MSERRVILRPEAERNLAHLFNWLAERSPQGAERWYQAFAMAIERLKQSADSCPIAYESRHFDCEIRDLLF